MVRCYYITKRSLPYHITLIGQFFGDSHQQLCLKLTFEQQLCHRGCPFNGFCDSKGMNSGPYFVLVRVGFRRAVLAGIYFFWVSTPSPWDQFHSIMLERPLSHSKYQLSFMSLHTQIFMFFTKNVKIFAFTFNLAILLFYVALFLSCVQRFFKFGWVHYDITSEKL